MLTALGTPALPWRLLVSLQVDGDAALLGTLSLPGCPSIVLQVAVDASASGDANAARSLRMPRMLTLPYHLLIMLQVVKACKNAKKPGNRCLTSHFRRRWLGKLRVTGSQCMNAGLRIRNSPKFRSQFHVTNLTLILTLTLSLQQVESVG